MVYIYIHVGVTYVTLDSILGQVLLVLRILVQVVLVVLVPLVLCIHCQIPGTCAHTNMCMYCRSKHLQPVIHFQSAKLTLDQSCRLHRLGPYWNGTSVRPKVSHAIAITIIATFPKISWDDPLSTWQFEKQNYIHLKKFRKSSASSNRKSFDTFCGNVGQPEFAPTVEPLSRTSKVRTDHDCRGDWEIWPGETAISKSFGGHSRYGWNMLK